MGHYRFHCHSFQLVSYILFAVPIKRNIIGVYDGSLHNAGWMRLLLSERAKVLMSRSGRIPHATKRSTVGIV